MKIFADDGEEHGFNATLLCTGFDKDQGFGDKTQAAIGYDVWKANVWGNSGKNGGDPGKRSKVFEIDCITGPEMAHIRPEGYYDFVDVYADFNCEKSVTVKTVKTFKDYLTETESSSMHEFKASNEVSFEGFGVGFNAEAKYENNRNSETGNTKKLFEQKQGEVVIARASCNTEDVLMTRNNRKLFSRNFIRSLERMNRSIVEKNVEKQDEIVKDFIYDFGTHYTTHAQFGAAILFEQRFTEKSIDDTETSARSNCVAEAVGGCIGGSYEGALAQASAKACTELKNGKCSNSKFDKNWGSTNGISSVRIKTVGSQLSSQEDWGQMDHLKPVVIR